MLEKPKHGIMESNGKYVTTLESTRNTVYQEKKTLISQECLESKTTLPEFKKNFHAVDQCSSLAMSCLTTTYVIWNIPVPATIAI